MISNVVLPVFFLYFVLISGYCSTLLNCGLQRFMRDSVYFKHVLIILSIYIFTFILNWYTFDSLAIGQENFQSEENILENKALKKLGVWVVYTLIIYLIFLISTKSEVIYIIIFFAYTIISIILQIIIKSVSSSVYNNINKLFITKDDYRGKHQSFVITAHNSISAGFIITMSLLIFGFYQYFQRQYADHAHHWNTGKFIFGTSKCRDA
jgi:hypothetical protein